MPRARMSRGVIEQGVPGKGEATMPRSTMPQGVLERGFPGRGEATTPRARTPRAARSHLRVRCRFVREGEVASSPSHTTHRTRTQGRGLLDNERAHRMRRRGGLASVLEGEDVASPTSTTANAGATRYPHLRATAQERNFASCARATKHPRLGRPRARIGPMQPSVRAITPLRKLRIPFGRLGLANFCTDNFAHVTSSRCSRTTRKQDSTLRFLGVPLNQWFYM